MTMIGDVKAVVNTQMRAAQAAAVLRACGTIQIYDTILGDDDAEGFPYAVGAFFSEDEGCVTYQPSPEGITTMIFTRFNHRDEILQLRDRVRKLEGDLASLKTKSVPAILDVLSEYVMLLTLRADSQSPGAPGEREKELYLQLRTP